ncbi:hypothetical protein Hanom_Chr13g01223531 [Helianthus anomalus]
MFQLKVSRFWDYYIRFGGGVEPNGGEYYVEYDQLGRIHSLSCLRINKVVSLFQTKIPWNRKYFSFLPFYPCLTR